MFKTMFQITLQPLFNKTGHMKLVFLIGIFGSTHIASSGLWPQEDKKFACITLHAQLGLWLSDSP